MGGFDYNKIKDLINDNYKIAIESGTFRGKGTIQLSKHFKKVYTVEIDENLFNEAKKRFIKNKNIVCIHGDSKEVFPKLFKDINIKDRNILFWLDAHWSGDSSVDWKKSKWGGYKVNTGYVGEKVSGIVPGPNQVPLGQEIRKIYDSVKSECVLYIDDFDKIDPKTLKGLKNKCFEGEDYSHLDFNDIFNYIDDRLIFKEVANKYCILKFKALS